MLDVEGRLVGGGYVRCGKGKYEEVEGRLVKEGVRCGREAGGRRVWKLKGGWWRRVC